MGGYRLKWRGDEVERRVTDAARGAIDETTEAAASMSNSNAPAGTKGAIRNRPAHVLGNVIRGVWGIFSHRAAVYALRVERGDARWPGRPYLRPAQDAEHPRLAARIKSRLR